MGLGSAIGQKRTSAVSTSSGNRLKNTFEDKSREAFDIRVNIKSCSVKSSGRRILRAKQAKPGARVRIKLAQSSTPERPVEFTWDGSSEQIGNALDTDRKLLLARGEVPSF